MRRLGLLALYAVAGASLPNAATAQQERAERPAFTLDDLGNLAKLSSPALSPDGTQAALVVGRPDHKTNTVVNLLVVVDVKTGASRVIATGNVASPAWSPQGTMLAWLAPDADKNPQINVIAARVASASGSTISRATSGGVSDFAWSPDGTSLAYLAAAPAQLPAGEERFDRSFGISPSDYHSTSFLARTAGDAPARLWLVGVQGGTPRTLTFGPAFLTHLAWQSDGKAIIVSSQPGASPAALLQSSLVSVDPVSGKQTILVGDTAYVGSDGRLASASSGVIAYQHFRGSDPWTYPNQAAVLENGQVRDVTRALDRDIDVLKWLPDGKSLIVKAQDGTVAGLWSVSLSGAAKRLSLGSIDPVSDVSVSRDGALAFIASEPALPPELYVMASPSAKPVRLTDFNHALVDRHLGRIESISWQNGGFDHNGVLTFPPDFHQGAKYPLLVRVHGGPEFSASATYNPASQFYAAHGWLVFEPNYRGSNDQGDRYQSAIVGDILSGSADDIMAGISAVKSRNSVDDARVAIDGWSWGGVMTSWMIGHHDWCAAIPGASVSNFTDYYSQSQFGFWIKTLLGSPYLPENRQKYVDQSPANYLFQAKTPTLVIHNAGDPNAPVTQAYGLFYALRDRGIKARLYLRDVNEHGYGDPYQAKGVFVNELAWLDENCRR